MIHYISLDTNIYRQLGIDFWNKLDFINLKKFLDQRSYELIMTNVVFNELVDHYSNEVLNSIINEYTRVFLRIENTPLFGKMEIGNITLNELQAKKDYLRELNHSCLRVIAIDVIKTDELLKFLIDNKQETKKDNTRDFIIFKTLVSFAIKNPKEKIVFITNDKFFTDNFYLKKIYKKNNIKNLIIFDSIASYLNKFGAKYDFLTDDLVLHSIKDKIIRREILKDIKCLPSYIIRDYNDLEKVPELQDLKIDEIKVFEYYTYYNENEKLKIAISIQVRIIAVFESDKNKDYRNYEIEKYHEENKNRIDQFNRPIYDNIVLFILEGDLLVSSKSINRIRFIDFLPNYNVNKSYA
jgi:hypothetical protein